MNDRSPLKHSPIPVTLAAVVSVLFPALGLLPPGQADAQMLWDPFIVDCMKGGSTRAECFERLPPDLLTELEAYEAAQREQRRVQRTIREAVNAPNGAVFGQVVVSGDSLDWSRIARLSREEAITLAQTPGYAQYRQGILNLVFQMWAVEDPAAAHERLLSLPSSVDKTPIEVQIIEYWMRIEPARAMQAAANSESRQTFESSLRAYAHLDPSAAIALAQSFGARVGRPAWIGILEGVASTNPELAARHVASLGEDGEYLVDAFIGDLTLKSPARALDWLLEHFPRQTRHYDSIAGVFYVRDSASAFAYLARMENGTARIAFSESLAKARAVNARGASAGPLSQRNAPGP